MRQTKNAYTANASFWTTIPAGSLVATNEATVGDTHSDWKLINYVRQSNGNWIDVPGGYVFVDTGISVGSGYNGIAFYGSW